MNFPEVIVLPRFEELLSLLSEDLNICMSTAVLGDTQFKRPTDVLLRQGSLGKQNRSRLQPTHSVDNSCRCPAPQKARLVPHQALLTRGRCMKTRTISKSMAFSP